MEDRRRPPSRVDDSDENHSIHTEGSGSPWETPFFSSSGNENHSAEGGVVYDFLKQIKSPRLQRWESKKEKLILIIFWQVHDKA